MGRLDSCPGSLSEPAANSTTGGWNRNKCSDYADPAASKEHLRSARRVDGLLGRCRQPTTLWQLSFQGTSKPSVEGTTIVTVGRPTILQSDFPNRL